MEYSQSICALNGYEEIGTVADTVRSGFFHIHLDFMDFKYVKAFGNRISEVKYLKKRFPEAVFDAHLMVKSPYELIEQLSVEGVNIFFIPVSEYREEKVDALEKRLKVNISVFLEADQLVAELQKIIKRSKYVLLMTINKIGGTGVALNPELLKKAKQIKNMNPKIQIYSDGGLRLENVKLFKDSNIDVAVGGSIIRNFPNSEDFKNWWIAQ